MTVGDTARGEVRWCAGREAQNDPYGLVRITLRNGVGGESCRQNTRTPRRKKSRTAQLRSNIHVISSVDFFPPSGNFYST